MAENEKFEEEMETEETVDEAESVEGTVEDPEEVSEETEENGEETEEGTDKKEKKAFFKKKEKKKDAKDEKIEDLTDKLTRLMAEFDNYRKRTEKEKAAAYDNGSMKVIEKVLPVVDNFERGLTSIPEEKREDPVYQGMDMIYKQMVKALTELGVEPIDAAGKEFDPNLHNAVMQVESDELESNTVAQELQKGYLYKGSVVRHSMVSVVQ